MKLHSGVGFGHEGAEVRTTSRNSAVLFTTTFWSIPREFSSLTASSSRTGRRAPPFQGTSVCWSATSHFDRGCTFFNSVAMQTVNRVSRNAKTVKLHSERAKARRSEPPLAIRHSYNSQRVHHPPARRDSAKAQRCHFLEDTSVDRAATHLQEAGPTDAP